MLAVKRNRSRSRLSEKVKYWQTDPDTEHCRPWHQLAGNPVAATGAFATKGRRLMTVGDFVVGGRVDAVKDRARQPLFAKQRHVFDIVARLKSPEPVDNAFFSRLILCFDDAIFSVERRVASCVQHEEGIQVHLCAGDGRHRCTRRG